MLRLLVVLMLTAGLSVEVIGAPSFIVEPSGQATTDTCQSYALSVALSFKQDPKFHVQNADELRATETAIRARILKEAGAGSVTHESIKSGFDAYTNGRYRLVFRDVDPSLVGDAVALRSGIRSAAATPPTFFLGAVVKDVVLASATRIGKDKYGAGHIFTILGVDGPPNSTQQFLILNSAVKVKDTRKNSCTDGVPDDPGPYTASLSWKDFSDIEFKRVVPGKVRLWQVE